MAEIKVYSTPTCHWCSVVKNYLRTKGVAFEEIDVSEDPAAARKMIQKSGEIGVPQIEINGKMIVGFDEEQIEIELAKKK